MREVYIGRNAAGERVTLDLELTVKPTVAPHQDIEHRPAESVLELTMQAASYDRTGRMTRGGQAIELLREVAQGGRVEGPYSAPELLRLAELWERHHLNGVIPGCAHQGEIWTCTGAPDGPHGQTKVANGWPVVTQLFGPHPYPKRGDACVQCGRARWDEPSDKCSVSGYRYGTAWLSRTIPAADLAELQGFEARAAKVR